MEKRISVWTATALGFFILAAVGCQSPGGAANSGGSSGGLGGCGMGQDTSAPAAPPTSSSNKPVTPNTSNSH